MSTVIPSDIKPTNLNSYVGFDTVTSQIEKKLLKRGFQLNVLLVGETGLGKSTLINTLFAAHLIDSKGRITPEEPIRQTVDIEAVTHVIKENAVKLALTIVDTPGYGDQINNDNCWEPIVRYIKEQQSSYFWKELSPTRERYIKDTRIHCCLFFIAPTGHSLKPLDILVLQKLSEVANVVPVIAKSDSLTKDELISFKKRIRSELDFYKINYYPYVLSEDEREIAYPEELKANEAARERIPFAIIGSEKLINVKGKEFYGRKTRWGIINVEDENHCEFVHLRDFLTRTHLQDLVETTQNLHYEAFRTKHMLTLKESQQHLIAPK